MIFDGVGCAILGMLKFCKENIDIEYCEYSNINEKVEKFLLGEEKHNYDEIYITDISVNESIADLIDISISDLDLPKLQLLDHHLTALWLNKYDWAKVEEYLDENKGIKTSGTYMCYDEWFNQDESDVIDEFADIVRRYDTWQWKKDNDLIPKQWNDLMYLIGRERFIDKILNIIDDDCPVFRDDIKKFSNFYFDKSDSLLLELNQEKIDRYIESKNKEIIRKDILGYKAGIIFAEQYHSELGNRICEMNSDIDFIAIINMSRAVSYRAIKESMNTGRDIAKVYGGGGHAPASGSEISNELRNKVLDLIFEVR